MKYCKSTTMGLDLCVRKQLFWLGCGWSHWPKQRGGECQGLHRRNMLAVSFQTIILGAQWVFFKIYACFNYIGKASAPFVLSSVYRNDFSRILQTNEDPCGRNPTISIKCAQILRNEMTFSWWCTGEEHIGMRCKHLRHPPPRPGVKAVFQSPSEAALAVC